MIDPNKRICPVCGITSYTANTISDTTCPYCMAVYHRVGGVLKPTKPMSNYDRIRNMSVEEMAKALLEDIYDYGKFCRDCEFKDCSDERAVGCMTRWLREEVKGND